MRRVAPGPISALRAPHAVIGFHGCSQETATLLLAGEPVVPSARRYDWLGVGFYFWEYGPFRAREWAVQRLGSQAAVLKASIRLGRCLNMLDVEHAAGFGRAYELAVGEAAAKGLRLPENLTDGRHYRDRLMVEYYCKVHAEATGRPFQTVRACYPEGEPVFPGSRILSRTPFK